MDTVHDAFWINYKINEHLDQISKLMNMLMTIWWVQNISISPNQKGVVWRINVKDFGLHPTHYL
jgi:hypothetical protein